MRKKIVVFIATLFCLCVTLPAQTVSNVQFEQVDNKVKITYLLDKQADISVSVSEDGGKTWRAPLKQVSGGVGKQVQPGSKTIYWNVLAEYDQIVGNNICFWVMAQVQVSGITQGAVRNITINGVSFKMVYVEGGTFTMGTTTEEQEISTCTDGRPTHRVTLSNYYIGQTEVTQSLWQAVMGSNPSCNTGNSLPVENVSWDDCQTFIRKLNSLTGLRFALPTEAQWEYAARGGKQSKGYKFAGSNYVNDIAWCEYNSKSTQIVATKQPNELGLYDMSGNVEEWCQDWYGRYSSAAQTNPTGASSGTYRVQRGGSYCYSLDHAESYLVSHRSSYFVSKSTMFGGLRLVLLP